MASPVIFIVEDERLVADFLTAVLERGGYQVLSAGSVARAAELLQVTSMEVALLLCDIVLEDGVDTASRIRELRPGVKTLFTSGYPLDVLFERGLIRPEFLQNENTFFISKPFLPGELLRLVHEVLSPSSKVATAGMEEPGATHVAAAH